MCFETVLYLVKYVSHLIGVGSIHVPAYFPKEEASQVSRRCIAISMEIVYSFVLQTETVK